MVVFPFFMMLFMLLLPLVVLAVLIVGAVALWNWLSRRSARPWLRGHDAAVGSLREQYARGEISREEFEERRRVLRESA
jgi:putative membrane protein